MTLYVSKLSVGRSKRPLSPKIYDEPCKFHGIKGKYKKITDEDVESIEDYEEITVKNNLMKNKLIEEFQNGRLRQGWGCEDDVFSLDLQYGVGSFRDDTGIIQPTEKWVCDYMHLYHSIQEEAIGRFRIVSRLLNMEDGDIVFVPNIPSNDMFSVATVDGGYEFAQIEDFDFENNFGHIIHVKNIEKYHYGEDTILKKLWSFPPAVVRIRNDKIFNEFLRKSYFKS